MNSNKAMIQAVEYQQTLFETSYQLFASFQDKGQQMVDKALENSSFIPDSSVKLYSHWIDFIKQNNETCKEYVDAGFDTIKEQLLKADVKPAPAKPKAPKKSD